MISLICNLIKGGTQCPRYQLYKPFIGAGSNLSELFDGNILMILINSKKEQGFTSCSFYILKMVSRLIIGLLRRVARFCPKTYNILKSVYF